MRQNGDADIVSAEVEFSRRGGDVSFRFAVASSADYFSCSTRAPEARNCADIFRIRLGILLLDRAFSSIGPDAAGPQRKAPPLLNRAFLCLMSNGHNDSFRGNQTGEAENAENEMPMSYPLS